MSLWLNGIGVSRGIAIGRVQKLHGGDLDIPEYTVPEIGLDAEVARFRDGQARARAQLAQVRDQVPASLGGARDEIAAFIDTHLLMMDDRALTEAVVATIRSRRINAEAALKRQRDALVELFEQMDDAYLRARRDDICQVSARVLRVLLRQERSLPVAGTPAEPGIVVADDLTPADIILLAQTGIAAFITESGGPLSHTAILARSYSIPAIVGLHGARRLLRDGETLIVDGARGHALADPEAQALAFFRAKREAQQRQRASLSSLRDQPAISRDGIRIHLLANLEQREDAREAAAQGAEGVGLYRTEFLFLNRQDPPAGLPSEEEQYQAYARIVASAQGPITIRTLDLGADKQVDTAARPGPTPNNPALGLRAIRLCLKEPELFRSQVRALLRASVHGDMRIMLPMISSVAEYRQAQAFIDATREQLAREGVAMAARVPLGAMIEVPAAALAASALAHECSFFSIGTNDLIQYTLAIDRVDNEVNYLYDPLHPSVLRLIRMTIEAGAAAGIPVAMCGEMAGDPRYTRLLLGLGLTEFSMHPASVLEVKRTIIESDVGALRSAVPKLLDSGDGEALAALLGAPA